MVESATHGRSFGYDQKIFINNQSKKRKIFLKNKNKINFLQNSYGFFFFKQLPI